MDLWGLTIAVLRRWYITLPLLAMSLATAFMVGQRAQAEYEVIGSLLLVAPPQTNPNPFADDHAAEILGIQVGSSSTRADMLAQGFSDGFELDYERGSPIMSMRVVSISATVAVETAEEVVARLDEALREGQMGRQVPNASRVTMDIVDAPDAVEPVVSGQLRLTAVIAVVGVILSLAFALLADVFLLRRRKAAARISVPGGASPTAPTAAAQRPARGTRTPSTNGRKQPTAAKTSLPEAEKQRPSAPSPRTPNAGKQRTTAASSKVPDAGKQRTTAPASAKRPTRGRERRPSTSKS